ncbi:Hypothetical predicted protein [Mytilus galloprovincialis]|uniref:Uncharacterized protein n=1 Tax=Mytilus galloprovincialis TaxID=29158 RepID=A0A8B6CDL8_MYTGA|nr:Hypothetical predicted protein [Mytilus galloprovincialis]
MPFGERHLKLSSGEVMDAPNIIRCMGPATIIQQYKAYCEENEISLLGVNNILLQPVEEAVKKFIHSTVFEQNTTSTKEMGLLVEMYVRHRFQNDKLPPKTNKRFWPSLKDLQNHIAFALKKQGTSPQNKQEILAIT